MDNISTITYGAPIKKYVQTTPTTNRVSLFVIIEMSLKRAQTLVLTMKTS
jgi:hypothetical protein